MWVKRLTFLPRQVAGGEHEVFVLGLRGQLVGHGHAVEAGPYQRVLGVVLDLLTEDVDLQVEVGHALDVLLGGLERHAVSLLTSHAAQAVDDPRSGMYKWSGAVAAGGQGGGVCRNAHSD